MAREKILVVWKPFRSQLKLPLQPKCCEILDKDRPTDAEELKIFKN